MVGGAGADFFHVDNVGDVVFDLSASDRDNVSSSIDFVLPGFIEELQLLSGAGIQARNATGNSQDNLIIGNDLNNVIDGKAGVDEMTGGLGDDIYKVDDPGDRIIELLNEGTDRVDADVSFTLDLNVENLNLTNSNVATNGTGNDLANEIIGSNQANILFGLDGDDRLFGTFGADTLIGGDGADRLEGGEDPGDIMVGGLGDDLYVVFNAAQTITELANEGVDTVEAFINFILPSEFENLLLRQAAFSASPTDDVGNAGDNVITGNAENNTLSGLDGQDTLIGGTGNDRLDGGAGQDIMRGGIGDDIYTVDNAGDVVDETGGSGTDTVNLRFGATLSNFTLGGDFENVDVLASGGVVTGNAGANTIQQIDPLGAATFKGLGGNDKLVGGFAADVIDGGAGNDVLTGLDGNDRLIGDSGADFFDGGEGIDRIFGNAGDDIINGGAGADTMSGQSGKDRYNYFKNDEADKITDFDIGMDTIAVSDSTGFTDFSSLSAVISGSTDTIIQFTATDSLTLLGIDSADLSATDFAFFASP
jgi:Ca2+-binding RTX toxin-like protein